MGVRLAKIKIDHKNMKNFLGLPEDVEITSIYTERERARGQRRSYSYVYIMSQRFSEINEWETAPEISFRDAKNLGTWDMEENE